MIFHNLMTTKKLLSYGKLIRFPHYETIFKYIFLIVLIITVFNVRDIQAFRNYATENGVRILDFTQLQLIPIFCFIIYVFMIPNDFFLSEYVSLNLSNKYQGSERELRVEKTLKWIFDFLFFTSSTVFAWYNFHEEDWFPKELLGQGQCENITKDYPFIQEEELLTKFYVFRLATHIYSTFELIFFGQRIEIKYWEYLLHHYVASTLVFFSLNLNILKLGAVVMVIHDISDIFLTGTRAYVDMKNANMPLVIIEYLMINITWFWSRVYVYPSCVLKIDFDFIPYLSKQPVWQHISNAWIFQTILMLILFLMHIYWSFYILKIGIGFMKGGKLKNVYDNKENKVE